MTTGITETSVNKNKNRFNIPDFEWSELECADPTDLCY